MLIFKFFLAVGLAALTLVEARGHQDKSKDDTIISTIHGIAQPIEPPLNHHSILLKDDSIDHHSYQPRSQEGAGAIDFSAIETRIERIRHAGPGHAFAKTRDLQAKYELLDLLEGYQALEDHRDTDNILDQVSTIEALGTQSPRNLQMMPEGPAGYTRSNLPAGTTSATTANTSTDTKTPTNTLPSASSINDEPPPFPHGPIVIHDIFKRNDWSVKCSGSNLQTRTRTCIKGNKSTALTGDWCAANCKCSDEGCMSCDSKKAPGCSKEVLTSTCSGTVRDWLCICTHKGDGTQNKC